MICKLRKYFCIYINCVWAYVPVAKDINQHNAGWKECKQYDENEGQERVKLLTMIIELLGFLKARVRLCVCVCVCVNLKL